MSYQNQATKRPITAKGRLLDALIERNRLKNDAALCRILDLGSPLISKIRHGKVNISADVMLRIHEAFEMPFPEMRRLMAEGEPGQDAE